MQNDEWGKFSGNIWGYVEQMTYENPNERKPKDN